MGTVVWKLKECLAARGLTPLQVEREAVRLGLSFGKNTGYRLTRGEGPERIDRRTLATLIEAVTSLSGRPTAVDDLLEYRPG